MPTKKQLDATAKDQAQDALTEQVEHNMDHFHAELEDAKARIAALEAKVADLEPVRMIASKLHQIHGG